MRKTLVWTTIPFLVVVFLFVIIYDSVSYFWSEPNNFRKKRMENKFDNIIEVLDRWSRK